MTGRGACEVRCISIGGCTVQTWLATPCDLNPKWVQPWDRLPAGKEGEFYKYGAEQPSRKSPPAWHPQVPQELEEKPMCHSLSPSVPAREDLDPAKGPVLSWRDARTCPHCCGTWVVPVLAVPGHLGGKGAVRNHIPYRTSFLCGISSQTSSPFIKNSLQDSDEGRV